MIHIETYEGALCIICRKHTKSVVFLDEPAGKGTPYDNKLLNFESASFFIMEYVFEIFWGIVSGTVKL